MPVKTEQPLKQHGGHNRGQLSEKAQGSGPVFQIRTQAGLTQAALSREVECGVATIHRAEAAGAWPSDARILRNLKALAKKLKITLTEPVSATSVGNKEAKNESTQDPKTG